MSFLKKLCGCRKKLVLLAGGVCAVRSEDVAPPVEALGGASAALRAGTGVNAVPAAADVGDVGDVGENRTLCAYMRQADLMSAGRRSGRPYARKPGPRATLCSKKTENRKPKTEKPKNRPGRAAQAKARAQARSSLAARRPSCAPSRLLMHEAAGRWPVAALRALRRSGCGQLWLAAAGQAREVGRGQLSGTCTHLLLLWPPGMLSLRTCCCICVDRPALLLLVE